MKGGLAVVLSTLLMSGGGACSTCAELAPNGSELDASGQAPDAELDASAATDDGSQAELFEAHRRLLDETVPTEVAFRDGLRANFRSMRELASRSGGRDPWPAIGALNDTGVLGLSLSGARRVRSRSGTRSCAGRPRCRGVAVTVHASNAGERPLRLTLTEERHSGPLPATSLVACARSRVRSDGGIRGACTAAYLVEHDTRTQVAVGRRRSIELSPGASTSFDVRFDWAGTGSLIGYSIVDADAGGSYDAAVGIAFERGEETHVAFSDVTLIEVPEP